MKKIDPPIAAKLVPAKNYSGCFHNCMRVSVVAETKMYWLVHDPISLKLKRYSKETGYPTCVRYSPQSTHKLNFY